jgi:hypothetical protein
LFIEEGDLIKVDTRTNEYQSRVNKWKLRSMIF